MVTPTMTAVPLTVSELEKIIAFLAAMTDASGLEYHYGYYGGTIIGKPGEIISETTPIAHGVLVRILRVRGDKTNCIVEYIDSSPTYQRLPVYLRWDCDEFDPASPWFHILNRVKD